MAHLEFIDYKPHRPVFGTTGIVWEPDALIRPVERLPQIFWADGSPWKEANLWGLEAARNRDVKLKTVKSLMEHLHKYAKWLEHEQIDWRHFPRIRAERVLIRYRGALINQRDQGELEPSTTTARMRAVIRFYRYCAGRNFISHDAPMWQDKTVTVRYFDTQGFERTILKLSTDISIPNRSLPRVRLEGGLLPITYAHMTELLDFAKVNASEELNLILTTGFTTGARLCTITTLHVSALQQAVRDPDAHGMWVIGVGPGTGIETKFDVSGNLMVPDEVMILLKDYACSKRHVDRTIKANGPDKRLLFLTRYGKPFKTSTVDREMVRLRRRASAADLKFMQTFKFHQTRATFGTLLMKICLEKVGTKTAIEFVKGAMHHKHESSTFGYIKFIEHTKAKIDVSNAFTEVFLGRAKRLRESADA